MIDKAKLFLAASASVLALGTSAAMASGPTVVEDIVVAPPPVQAPAFSWEGFYGGLSYSNVTGQINQNTAIPTQLPNLVGDRGLGAFVGYNWQRGNLVFGGELAYTNFSSAYVGFANSIQSDALELRGRAGYAMNRVMFYGFLGYAQSELMNGGTQFNMTGFSYGLGVEAFVTRNMTVGLEIARRDVSDTVGFTLGSNIDTVALRVGFHF